jgi:hypothetical protein
VIAAEGLVAIGRMIVAYRRGDGAATNYEIAWVTVALAPEGWGRCLGPDKSRAPCRLGDQSLASGHGAT